MIYKTILIMKTKKLKLGIVGGGPKSWIGHVHRIAARYDDQYEIVAGATQTIGKWLMKRQKEKME